MRERMLWIGLGLLSLLLAAALGLATSRLTEAPIGLSAEPVSAGEALAPKPTATATATATREPRRRDRPKRSPTPTATASATAVPTVDDSGSGSDDSGSGSDDSGGDSSGKGRGGDDD